MFHHFKELKYEMFPERQALRNDLPRVIQNRPSKIYGQALAVLSSSAKCHVTTVSKETCTLLIRVIVQ